MISAETIRQWVAPPYADVLEQRLALRREHRRIERELHGRGK